MNWSSGVVATIGLAELEQRDVGKATVAIALHGCEQAWQQARAHRRHLDRDRVGEFERLGAAAEQLGLARGMNDHVTASTSPRAASKRRARRDAALALGQHGVRATPAHARQRRRGHAIETGNAHDLFHEIGGAVDVGPPASAPSR